MDNADSNRLYWKCHVMPTGRDEFGQSFSRWLRDCPFLNLRLREGLSAGGGCLSGLQRQTRQEPGDLAEVTDRSRIIKKDFISSIVAAIQVPCMVSCRREAWDNSSGGPGDSGQKGPAHCPIIPDLRHGS